MQAFVATEAARPDTIDGVTLDKLRGKLILSLLFGVLVFVVLSAYADFNDVITGLKDFRWELLPAVCGLTFLNYLLRFWKWQYYLKIIKVEDLPTRTSAEIYFAGLGMVVTPGKVGEWMKCYLLREIHGTPFSRSAPIVIAERLTDSLGLAILGLAGLLIYGSAWPVFVVILAGSAVMFFVARHQPMAYWLLHRLEHMPLVARFAKHAEEFYTSSYALLSPISLLAMTLNSVVSWGFEVLAFYLVLIGSGASGGADTLLKASFIFSASTLASAILLTPGGLGVAEGGLAGLSVVLLNVSKSQAAVATLLIRFGTLWFGVLVGVVALAMVGRRLPKSGIVLEDPDSLLAPSEGTGGP